MTDCYCKNLLSLSIGAGFVPKRGCRVCLKHGNRKNTRYFCSHCGVSLCINPCFNLYHEEAEY